MIYRRIIPVLMCALSVGIACPQVPAAQKSAFDYATTPLIVASAATLYYLTATPEQRENLLTQLKPQNIVINFIKEYVRYATVTIGHEAGHATAHKMITGRGSTIHFGSTETKRNNKPLCTIGTIQIDGLIPTQGHTEHHFMTPEETDTAITTFVNSYCCKHKLNPTQLTPDTIADITASEEFESFQKSLLPAKTQYALFLLAGGIAGIITNQIFKLTFKEKNIDPVVFSQLISMLMPYAKNSDGAALLRDCADAPSQFIKACITLAPLVDIMAEIYCTMADQNATPTASLHSKAFIGIINYFLRGYLRFHA